MEHEEHKIAEVKNFQSLEDFIRGCNNFYTHFYHHDESLLGCEFRREEKAFKRFQKNYPKFEDFLTTNITRIMDESAEVPDVRSGGHLRYIGRKFEELKIWERLFEAYKLMSQLIYWGDDKELENDGHDYRVYLTK